MMRDRKAIRPLLALSVLAAVALVPAAAHADDREQCITSAEQAQTLRDEGKYRRAREQMLVCARDVCPAAIKSDCGKWLDTLDREAPTVVFGARDAGKDVTDVKVSMDGVVVAERLDGKPQLVDTGEHTFTFERGGAVKEEKVLVRAGEKGRAISVTFGAATAAPAPAPAAPAEEASIVPALVVGGIGVAALGSFAYFGISGKSDVDKARTKLIIADISLVGGVVALAVSAYMIITRPKVPDHVNVQAAKASPRVRFDVAPTLGGGAAAIGGTF